MKRSCLLLLIVAGMGGSLAQADARQGSVDRLNTATDARRPTMYALDKGMPYVPSVGELTAELRAPSIQTERASDSTSGNVSITCSSNDERRRNCPVDTQNGVRLLRQLSGSPCREGATWGYDANGIWVDRGCRAEFEILSSRNRRYGRSGSEGRYDAPRIPSTLSVDRNNNVNWQASTRNASVYVQVDGQSEKLFAQGGSGTQPAPWMERGHTYTFVLRDENRRELTRTQVDLRGGRGGFRGSDDRRGQ